MRFRSFTRWLTHCCLNGAFSVSYPNRNAAVCSYPCIGNSVFTDSRERSDDICDSTQRCGEWVPVLRVTPWLNVINPELAKDLTSLFILYYRNVKQKYQSYVLNFVCYHGMNTGTPFAKKHCYFYLQINKCKRIKSAHCKSGNGWTWNDTKADAFNISFGANSCGRIWSACGKHEIQYAEWRINKYTYNYMYNFAGRIQSVRIGNSTFERVEEFKNLEQL